MDLQKICILFHGRFPGEKAASLFTAKNAEAFARQGIEVEVIVPRRRGVDPSTAHSHFNVEANFAVTEVFAIDVFGRCGSEKLAFYASYISYAISCFFRLRGKVSKKTVVYSNEFLPLYAATFVTNDTMYEMHDFPESKFRIFGTMLRSFSRVLVHNTWKLQKLHKTFVFPSDKVLCEPNAVDVDAFNLPLTTQEARRKLALPEDKKIVLYTGHLYGWKGVDTLAKAAESLHAAALVVFVGGTPKDIEGFKQKYGDKKNIRIVGHVPHKDIPVWQKAADVLVIPNTAQDAISAYYTSPMKLYEYMASRKPIIASDLPSIREIVDEKSAFFVPPDNPLALKTTIEMVFKTNTTSVTEAAWNIVQNHTWNRRSERIVRFMKATHDASSVNLNLARLGLLVRYFFSGLSAFAVNMMLLFVLTHYFNVWYLAASSIAFIISVFVSFAAQKFITFRDSSKSAVPYQRLLYVLIALFNVAANGFFMYLLVDMLSVHYLFAQVIAAAVIAAWSLVVYRFVIFPHAKTP